MFKEMRLRFGGILLAAALALAILPARAADNIPIKDGAGNSLTACTEDNGGVHIFCHYMVGATGGTVLGTAGTANAQVLTVQGIASMTPVLVTLSGTNNVTNAGTFAVQAAQSGTWNVTNISGTVSLPTGASSAANQTTIIGHLDGVEGSLTSAVTALQLLDNAAGTVAAGTAGTGSLLSGCVYNSGGITLTNGQQAACQFTSTGALRVSVDAAVGTAEAATASGTTQSGTMGEGRTTDKTSVTSGQMTRDISTLDGRKVVHPYAIPENMISCVISTAMTGTTSTSLCAAPGAGLRNYITSITCGNSHATVGTNIIIQDGSGGTTIGILPAAAVYGGAAPSLPSPLRQPTANTALHVANVTTGASTTCWAVGYKGI